MSIAEAAAEVAKIDMVFTTLYETPASYAMLKTLLVSHRVIGVQVHDTRLVSVMQAHGLTEIVTFNLGITIIHPDKV